MSINNVNNAGQQRPQQLESQKLNQQQQTQGQASASAARNQAPASAPRQDSVSLTQSAQQLSQTQRRGSEAPVNQERVERLKSAIQDGSFKVDAGRLAQNIIRSEGQLFGLK